MTPREKALNLFYKYNYQTSNEFKSDSFTAAKTAKGCALIAVNELIEFAYNYTDYNEKSTKEYWEKVKKEIENL